VPQDGLLWLLLWQEAALLTRYDPATRLCSLFGSQAKILWYALHSPMAAKLSTHPRSLTGLLSLFLLCVVDFYRKAASGLGCSSLSRCLTVHPFSPSLHLFPLPSIPLLFDQQLQLRTPINIQYLLRLSEISNAVVLYPQFVSFVLVFENFVDLFPPSCLNTLVISSSSSKHCPSTTPKLSQIAQHFSAYLPAHLDLFFECSRHLLSRLRLGGSPTDHPPSSFDNLFRVKERSKKVENNYQRL
jgi:hypothetical protein